jgi:arylsulfatase A-like enzyme
MSSRFSSFSVKEHTMSRRFFLSCRIWSLFALLVVHLIGSDFASAAISSRPNMVLIFADDMGYGDVGCFNPDSKIPTPNLDRLASEGMRFTDAHAPASLCVPSRYGLLSGRYPHRGKILWKLPGSVLEEDHPTLASVLQQADYRTVCVGKWHLGYACDHPTKAGQAMPGGPIDRGFDHAFCMHASLDIPPYYYIEDGHCVMPPSETCEDNYSEGWTKIQGAFWRGGGIAPGLKHEDVLPRFKNEALGYIDRHRKETPQKPLFLYLALPAPHTPWLPAEKYQGTSTAGMYGDYTAQVDGVVGAVMQELEEQKMSENTLFIFTSDNGPVWYESDEARFHHASSGPFRGMKGDIWEGGHRMPMIVRWPGETPAETECDHLFSFTDFFATLAAIVDVPFEATIACDSIDQSALFRGAASERSPRTQMIHSAGGTLALRQGPWKMIPALGSQGFTKPRGEKPKPEGPTGQLYHLVDDPGETTNLWLKHPEIVKQMQSALQKAR